MIVINSEVQEIHLFKNGRRNSYKFTNVIKFIKFLENLIANIDSILTQNILKNIQDISKQSLQVFSCVNM